MDSDTGDLKAELGAHRRLIMAISETQSDHTTRLRELREGEGQAEILVGVKAIRRLLGDDSGSGN